MVFILCFLIAIIITIKIAIKKINVQFKYELSLISIGHIKYNIYIFASDC